MARGPPDPSRELELVTSGVSGPEAETCACSTRRIGKGITAARSSEWIGDIGVVKNVEELGSELCSQPFLELHSLGQRKIPVVVGQATENPRSHPNGKQAAATSNAEDTDQRYAEVMAKQQLDQSDKDFLQRYIKDGLSQLREQGLY